MLDVVPLDVMFDPMLVGDIEGVDDMVDPTLVGDTVEVAGHEKKFFVADSVVDAADTPGKGVVGRESG